MTVNIDKACCFTGHRKISPGNLTKLIERLNLEISYLVEHGIENFYTGGALGFDTIAALSVLKYKESQSAVKLHLILPCQNQCKGWSNRDIEIYKEIRRRADSVEILSDHYHGGVMHIRNRAMVDASKYCICYWENEPEIPSTGGTLSTVKYARKLGRKIINLWDEPPEDIQLEFDFS